MLANIKITDVVNINKLQEMSDSEKKSSESICCWFDFESRLEVLCRGGMPYELKKEI